MEKISIYPFNEGEVYYTIEGNKVIKSVWDDVSEELYDKNSNRDYFTTELEAVLYYQVERLGTMLTEAIDFIDSSNCDGKDEFMEAFHYFNSTPNINSYGK